MALIGNYSVLNKSAARFTNGTSTAGAYAGITPSNAAESGKLRNRFQALAQYSSTPNGTQPPYSLVVPQIGGGLAASVGALAGTGTISSTDVAQGKDLSSDLTGLGTISSADIALIVSIAAALEGSGLISAADLAAVQNLAATLEGTGTISNAELNLIIDMLATMTGTGAASADAIGLAHMTADVTPYTELSPETLAAALLNAVLANYNDVGTVGEALNNVGAGSNPWSSATSSNNDPGTMGELIQKLLTTAKFLGLK